MEIGFTLFIFVLLAMLLAVANLERQHVAFRWLTLLALASLNLLMIVFGLLSLAMAAAPMPGLSSELTAAYASLFRAVGLTGLLAFVPMIPAVRRLLARWLPIDPNSVIVTTALVYAIYLVGMGIGQQPLLSDAAVLESLGGASVGVATLWAQSIGMMLIAVSGVGIFTRRTLRETASRLGLAWPTWRQVGFGVLVAVGLVALQIAFSWAWQALDPQGMAQIDEASNVLLGDLTGSLLGTFTIGMAAALGEEMIFRGALLPPFRLGLTSVLFTIIHSQYRLSPALLLILAIALVLGLVRYRTNLTIAILVHFLYNVGSVSLSNVGQ
ncbi:MAG TPA: CPBP family intramembrane metalloprotease [Anaerolineae bacterium]|nr:CPBP family intramembrane metalloprotease [Anaerolineae bacterium]